MSEADQRREVLRQVMVRTGLTVNRWSTTAKVGNSLYNFLNGESHSLSQPTLEKLAKAAGLTVGDLTGGVSAARPILAGTITVRGDLSAGAWLEAVEWREEDQYGIDLPVPSRWRGKAYGLRIIGNSMNKRWPNSTIVMCVNPNDYGFDLVSGEDYVVVHRRNQLGHVEATAKRYEEHGSEIWLCPESDDPRYEIIKMPIVLDDEAPQSWGAEETIIAAVILGGYMPTRAGRR